MHAPRVSLALVTEGALPPGAALALTGGLTKTVLLGTARADGYRTIVAFPSRQTIFVSSGVTVEVAERVVPWAAEIRAFLAMVEFIAHNAIRKAQLALLSKIRVLGPVLADAESFFGGQPADQIVDVLC